MHGSQASRSLRLSDRMGRSFGIGSRCLSQVAVSRCIRELWILSFSKVSDLFGIASSYLLSTDFIVAESYHQASFKFSDQQESKRAPRCRFKRTEKEMKSGNPFQILVAGG
jgi:hypothetical protein